jgi:tryptophan synthase alpha chain
VNRITQVFEQLKADGRKGLIGYLTAGDPDAEQSEQRVRRALQCGVDILELGVPFSDPTADGPVVGAAARRALDAGMTVGGALAMVRRLRRDFAQPIVLFGYANPFFRYGYEALARDAAEAGADGVLAVDLPFEEKDELATSLQAAGLAFIPLVAPTTPPSRMALTLADAEGFVYCITVRGVTGRRSAMVLDVDEMMAHVRACTKLPTALGFGIGNARQAAQAAAAADAVVVGSALIEAAAAGTMEELIANIKSGLKEHERV